MANSCSVCTHPSTKDINKLIVQGTPDTTIARKYDDLHYSAVRNHRLKHLPETLVRAVKADKLNHSLDVMREMQELVSRTKKIMDDAEGDNDSRLALKASKEVRQNIELLSKVAVKLKEYQDAEHQKESGQLDSQIKKGLEALTDKELEVYNALQTKIIQADPNQLLEPEAQRLFDGMSVQISYEHVNSSNISNNPDTNKIFKDSKENNFPDKTGRANPKSAPNNYSKNIDKTNKPDRDNLSLDDIELEELSLDDINEDALLDNTIPSEETDLPGAKHPEPWA